MNSPFAPSGKCTVLVVDDTPDNLSLMSDLLRTDYKVKLAPSGERALQIVAGDSKPDLILLDIMMPDMDGYEVLRRLQFNPDTEDIPVIFLTAMSAADDESIGLELGAVDYITKPINPAIVMARVRNHLQLKRARDFLAQHNHFLEQEVANRTRAMAELQDATIRAMASLAETRDNETGNHIRRTQHYMEALARHLQNHPRFKDELTDAAIETIFKSAPLHDIGKVGIPDRILLKPGKLTPEEFEIMKTHTTLGRDAIIAAETGTTQDNPFFRYAKEIAYSHQEKWDGSGYPEGLVGNTIPLSARLMAVADVYDALISERVYKPAYSHEQAVEIIRDGRGSHFDPDMVDAFLTLSEEFRRIAQQFADAEPARLAQVDRLAADLPMERIELTSREEPL
ncbi:MULTISPECIES: two-component system response regulator [unclassified Acidovorax]|uniref:response regulator n=1 Tax=Acidovorax TaxID=12916 RepID=UPI0006F42B3A|nr:MULTISPECIES: two-component system response regulator [unclassified Acidovorax]KQW24479.1 two-component system response regulator [Acidovorax sp. Root402]MBD9406687.1 two-component system response regulator [Acidovorax sp. ACV02]MCT6719497.1 two-component system response regulator [Acidovorax sp. K2F]PIF17879.1 putative two-component system response regulator [Acidovorax sp. 59]PKW03097.1 putative two-component system response regulator [Acidovorax sp. 30]